MPVIINAKATSWGKKITLAIVPLIFLVIIDILISIAIFLFFRTSDQSREMDLLEFLEWKYLIEMLRLWLMSILITCCILVYV